MAHALKGEKPEAGSEATDTEQLAKAPEVTKEYGVVAVVMGEGIARVFTSLGVDQVVFGGQTMNPSTEDLVEAARKTAARNIYILPNNANIILAARQVQEILKDRKVYVIPSKSIPQGISALMNFLPDEGTEKNLSTMEGALSRVGSGEVTYAVRDSQYDGFSIEEGDILGLVEDKLTVTGKDRLDVAKATLEHMNWRDYDLVTIFLGQDVVPEEAKTLEEWLHAENRDVEVEVYPGGQPLYYYILGVE